MGAVQHQCPHHFSKKLAIWILRGGDPKSHTLQGEPLLDQTLSVPTTGFDVDVQFCVDPVDNGALSSCPAGEGHTWGKVSAECVQASSVYVHTDLTAVFPWLVHALFAQKRKRPHRRLMDRLAEARATLDRAIGDKRDELMAEVERPAILGGRGAELLERLTR